jgi:hypothetical protein
MVLFYVKKKRNTTKRKYKSRVNITNAPKPFGEQNTARVPTKEESKLILHASNQIESSQIMQGPEG